MSRFQDVSVLVTGGARGIGRDLVTHFASEGAKVTFADLNDEAAAETVQQAGADRCRYVSANIATPEGAEAAVAAALELGGGLDVLVNNAGITRDTLLMRMSLEDWNQVLSVNLTGTFLVTKAALRRLMKSPRGRIVNIASVVGLMGNAGQTNYAASKGGIVAFTKSVAREVASRGVTANAVAPGFIQTDMTAALPEKAAAELQSRIPLGRLGAVEDVTAAVAFLASVEASYVTGQVITVDGGMVM
jgi:3-oxoacyl-[acyl-carrier protein] reductase